MSKTPTVGSVWMRRPNTVVFPEKLVPVTVLAANDTAVRITHCVDQTLDDWHPLTTFHELYKPAPKKVNR